MIARHASHDSSMGALKLRHPGGWLSSSKDGSSNLPTIWVLDAVAHQQRSNRPGSAAAQVPGWRRRPQRRRSGRLQPRLSGDIAATPEGKRAINASRAAALRIHASVSGLAFRVGGTGSIAPASRPAQPVQQGQPVVNQESAHCSGAPQMNTWQHQVSLAPLVVEAAAWPVNNGPVIQRWQKLEAGVSSAFSG